MQSYGGFNLYKRMRYISSMISIKQVIKEEGKVEGLIEVQSDLIQASFKREAKSWLQQLTLSQLKKITKLILNANSFEEIQLSVK